MFCQITRKNRPLCFVLHDDSSCARSYFWSRIHDNKVIPTGAHTINGRTDLLAAILRLHLTAWKFVVETPWPPSLTKYWIKKVLKIAFFSKMAEMWGTIPKPFLILINRCEHSDFSQTGSGSTKISPFCQTITPSDVTLLNYSCTHSHQFARNNEIIGHKQVLDVTLVSYCNQMFSAATKWFVLSLSGLFTLTESEYQSDSLPSEICFFLFIKFLENISPFRGATDTPVLDFWWHLSWV